MQKAAFIAHGHHSQRIRLAQCRHAGTLNRIDGNINGIAVTGTDFFTDIEHRGFVDFTLTDHNLTVNFNGVQDMTHGMDSRTVSRIFVTAS